MNPRRFKVFSPGNLWQVELAGGQNAYAVRDEAYICFAEATSGPTIHHSRWSLTGVFAAVLKHHVKEDIGAAVIDYYERLYIRHAPKIVALDAADAFLHPQLLDDMLNKVQLRPLDLVLREIEDLLLAIDNLPLIARRIARQGGAEHIVNAPRVSKWGTYEPILRNDPRYGELAEFHKQYSTVYARRQFMPLEGEDLADAADRATSLGLVALADRYATLPDGMKLDRLNNLRF